ncbi:MAG: hypothetical protein AAF416_04075 [Pseudomonadota bacterium]
MPLRQIRRARAVIAFAVVLGLQMPTTIEAADAPLDLLFATPHLEPLPPGATLTYGHLREAAEETGLSPGFAQRISLVAGTEEAPGVNVTMDVDGSPRQLDEFRGVPGNPLLMVFLESTVRAVNQATGGSPFYIRNRIREALRERLTSQPMILSQGNLRLPARALTASPFEGDKHAAQLGAFAALELRFLFSEQAPGMLIAMIAEAGPRTDPQTGVTSGPSAEDGAHIYYEEIRLELPR